MATVLILLVVKQRCDLTGLPEPTDHCSYRPNYRVESLSCDFIFAKDLSSLRSTFSGFHCSVESFRSFRCRLNPQFCRDSGIWNMSRWCVWRITKTHTHTHTHTLIRMEVSLSDSCLCGLVTPPQGPLRGTQIWVTSVHGREGKTSNTKPAEQPPPAPLVLSS